MGSSKQTVRKGYNQISRVYRDDQGRGLDAKNMIPWLRWLQRRLEKKDAVLELGCGMGIPAARFLARNYSYRGVDISDIQIKRADMSRLKFLRESFRAIVSFYAVILSALPEQKPLFRKIYRWVKPVVSSKMR